MKFSRIHKAHFALLGGLIVAGLSTTLVLTASSGKGQSPKGTEVLGDQFTGGGSGGTQQPAAKAPAAKGKPSPSPTPSPTPKKEEKVDKKAFTISGTVGELVPGVSRNLVLSLTNQNNFTIQVTSLTVTAADATTGCAATNLVLGTGGQAKAKTQTFPTAVNVAGDGQNTYTVPVTLSADAPMACAAKTWALTYAGSAVKP